MGVPWLRLLDAVIGVTDLARSRKIRSMSQQTDALQQVDAVNRGLGGLETRLAGVVVAALKEAFDRDTHRLELERQQLEAERLRAERAQRLELMRQAGEREIDRLRLLAGTAAVSWIVTIALSFRLAGSGVTPRALMGSGWALLLFATAASFAGQSRIARQLLQTAEAPDLLENMPRVTAGAVGAFAVWTIVSGLALAGAALLIV